VRIELESPIGGRAVAAWLYIAHNAPHRRDPSIHEVLSPWVEIEAQARCLIRIRRSHVQIPYPNFPAIIVL
jgi:hypothetical protein